MADRQKTLQDLLSPEIIQRLSIPSSFRYGQAIYQRGAVELIEYGPLKIEGWVGGLDGSVSEGGGQRRRTRLFIEEDRLNWHCAGNPKNHQVFCKHCVALALAFVDRAGRK